MWALSTCGEPDEIKKNTHPKNITALFHGQGLVEPPLLLWSTNLTAVKTANSTYGHTGEMARWQGHGIIV